MKIDWFSVIVAVFFMGLGLFIMITAASTPINM